MKPLKSKRQFPDVPHFAGLIDWKLPTFRRTKRRIDKAVTIYDLQKIAKRRVPRATYDYVEGGAQREISYERSLEAFKNLEPEIMRGVTKKVLKLNTASDKQLEKTLAVIRAMNYREFNPTQTRVQGNLDYRANLIWQDPGGKRQTPEERSAAGGVAQ